jgi:hypothetical protein
VHAQSRPDLLNTGYLQWDTPTRAVAGKASRVQGSGPPLDSVTGAPLPHCPACRVVAELSEHRDATAGGWSIRRATLNFAILTARQACPDHAPHEGSSVEVAEDA